MSEQPPNGPEQPRYPDGGQGQGYPPQGQPPYPQEGQQPYPQQGAPQYGAPQYGAPQYGAPQYGAPQYGAPQYGAPQYGQPYGSGPVRRPGQVTAAAAITWVCSGLVLVLSVLLLVAGLANSDAIYDEFRAQGAPSNLSEQDLRNVLVSTGVVMLIWCISAIVLAFFVFRGKNWARVTLTVSAGFTILFSLLGITQGASIITLVAAAVVIVLLYHRASSAWFRQGQATGPEGYPQAPPSGW